MYVAGYEVNCGRCCCGSEQFIIFLMVNRVVSSFQRLRASSLVPAFVLNLLLSIFFACTTCILLLVHYLLILIATFCVFCLVAAAVLFSYIHYFR